jgi:hypothetical protein
MTFSYRLIRYLILVIVPGRSRALSGRFCSPVNGVTTGYDDFFLDNLSMRMSIVMSLRNIGLLLGQDEVAFVVDLAAATFMCEARGHMNDVGSERDVGVPHALACGSSG